MRRIVPRSHAGRCVTAGLAAVTGLVFLAFVVAFVWHRHVSPAVGWKDWLDIGGEANLPTWWNATLLALVAAVALVSATTTPSGDRERRSWLVVAIAATYLSVDEATAIHERLTTIGERTGIDIATYAWLIPGVLLATAGVVVLVIAGRSLPAGVGASLAVALAAYGFAAVGLEAVSGWIRDGSDDSAWFTLAIAAEEGLEMMACVFAIGVIVDGLDVERADHRLTIGRRA